jgi:hypothetical protein
VTRDPWFKDYLETRKEGEHRRRSANQRSSLDERRERIETTGFQAANQTEVLLGLERASMSSESLSVTVEDFDPEADVHAIIRHDGQLRNAAVHTHLTELFEEETPLENTELAVCWEYGDIAELREYERNGYFGGEVRLNLENSALEYQNGRSTQIDIIEVKSLLCSEAKAVTNGQRIHPDSS